MTEFTAGGERYRSRLISVFDQWALLNRLKPILPALQGLDHGLRGTGAELSDVAATLAPLMRAGDEDMRAVFRACLAACERLDEGDWCPVTAMPSLVNLMTIAAVVIGENFRTFFAMKRPDFKATSYDGPQYLPVTMPNEEDWLFRPVLRGLCKVESLYDGTLRIEHLAKLNDAMAVEEENQARMRAALERKR